MEIALHEAKMMNLKLPGLELAHQLYLELKKLGHEQKGTHSLVLALEHMNAIHWSKD
jgi:3-hydroxyisobutyrate dehydrogenase